jgi:hypothetical protein
LLSAISPADIQTKGEQSLLLHEKEEQIIPTEQRKQQEEVLAVKGLGHFGFG